MSSPRKEGKTPYPSHEYPSWAFDPRERPHWLVGGEDLGDCPGSESRSTGLSAVSPTSLREE
jgi:hypothetical protein